MKILLLSGHYYNSKRKAGFHFLANEYAKMGFEVVFVTVPFSLFSIINQDYRLMEKKFINNLFSNIYFSDIKSIINFTLFHPTNRKFLDKNIMFKLNKRVKKEIIDANYIIFESNHSLYFYDEIEQINPEAKKIYRVSDDITQLNFPKSLENIEKRIINKFDLVSVPTEIIFNRLSKFSPNIKIHYHGINKEIFDKEYKNPYNKKYKNFIFVGNSHIDYKFLDIASKLNKNYLFHIIGPFEQKVQGDNIIYYGYMPFEETVKYIKYADVGLQILTGKEKIVKTFNNSLKVLQYSYCKLPIIAPAIMKSKRTNWFSYEYSTKSVIQCIENALNFDRKSFDNSDIYSWTDLAKILLN